MAYPGQVFSVAEGGGSKGNLTCGLKSGSSNVIVLSTFYPFSGSGVVYVQYKAYLGYIKSADGVLVDSFGVIAPYYRNAQVPVINIQPSDVTVKVGDAANLSVDASIGTGTLSYQWYSNATDSNLDGIIIASATNSSYGAPTTAAGTTYYYCIVTNTDNTANGDTIVSITSNTAKVIVSQASTKISINEIMDAFDEALANGKITSNGKGNKIKPFRKKLEVIKLKIENGNINAAINNLNALYVFIDGKPSPKDFIIGDEADDIAKMIYDLIQELK